MSKAVHLLSKQKVDGSLSVVVSRIKLLRLEFEIAGSNPHTVGQQLHLESLCKLHSPSENSVHCYFK